MRTGFLSILLMALATFAFSDGATLLLSPDAWESHLRLDLMLFWTSGNALGEPAGNFPTFRYRDGTPAKQTSRRPRMLGRQVYAYSMAYHLTGNPEYLGMAASGLDWLLENGRDKARGGWHDMLDKHGKPWGKGYKSSQDASYAAMGPAAYFFVTRDSAAKEALLSQRDEIFNPKLFWDETNRRVRDALLPSMDGPAPSGKDGGWELVSQLDQVNAWLLLSQPAMGASDSVRFAGDIRTLLSTITNRFWKDGIFYGRSSQGGNLSSGHTDFGHTLKTYWMLLLAGNRLKDSGFTAFALSNAPFWLDLAFDPDNGLWAEKMQGSNSVRYGSSWWSYAECDQLSATLSVRGLWPENRLAETGSNWLRCFVDTEYGEVFPGIDRFGNHDTGSGPSDTGKCNEWKNGFHSIEHALVLSILSSTLRGKPVLLYFAVPEGEVKSFVAKPYLFEGNETAREDLGVIRAGGRELKKVRVTFHNVR